MKTFIILFSLLFLILFSNCSENCEKETIIKTEYVYDGDIINAFSCGFAFKTTSDMFLPFELPTQYQVNGLRVRIKFELVGDTILCPGFIGNAKKIRIITIQII